MALRARHAKQWTVEWQSEDGFNDVVNKIERVLQCKQRQFSQVAALKHPGLLLHLQTSED